MKYEAPQKIPDVAAETPTITTTVTLAFQETVQQGWWWLAGIAGTTITVAGVVLTFLGIAWALIGWQWYKESKKKFADTDEAIKELRTSKSHRQPPDAVMQTSRPHELPNLKK